MNVRIVELRSKLNESQLGLAVNNTGFGRVVEGLSGVIARSASALLKGKPHLIGDILQNEALRSYLMPLSLGQRWDV